MKAIIADNKSIKTSSVSNNVHGGVLINGIKIKSVYINSDCIIGKLEKNKNYNTVDLITSSIKKMYIDGTDISVYEGSYNAVPDIVKQTLYTKNKYLENDIQVFSIPIWEIDNNTGTTIYIGKDNTYGL